jgi:hypothetical protein
MKALRIHHPGGGLCLKGDILSFGRFGRRLTAGDKDWRWAKTLFQRQAGRESH